jgi:hypothetical protein
MCLALLWRLSMLLRMWRRRAIPSMMLPGSTSLRCQQNQEIRRKQRRIRVHPQARQARSRQLDHCLKGLAQPRLLPFEFRPLSRVQPFRMLLRNVIIVGSRECQAKTGKSINPVAVQQIDRLLIFPTRRLWNIHEGIREGAGCWWE